LKRNSRKALESISSGEPVLKQMSPASTRLSPTTWLVLLLLASSGTYVFSDYWSTIPNDVTATFVGRSSCIECHQSEAEAFAGSHHDKAMDLATEETVLGDFNNATIEHDGMTSRLFRDGTKFMVHTEGPTGKMEDFEIKYVFGVDPLQQYMVEFDRNESTLPGEIARVQVLRISWDTHKKQWLYLRPPDVKEKLEPDDPLHWTGIAQRWQTMCADCHSTNLKTNFDVATTSYHTTFSEIDVSCEACHGPGSVHVELANAKSLFWDRKVGYGLTKLKGESSEPQLQTCAKCHSRRAVIAPDTPGGATYHDFYQVELLQPDTYFDDGQIKDEVYVYGSFTQSLMYHKGIRCSDCHDPHSLKLKHPGNETCTSCHQHPAGKYDVPSHHHHSVGSEGAKCVNCHMPGRTYMDVDFRRDHSLRIPRPDMSVEFGTPNACTDCHLKDHLEKVPTEVRSTLREYADWLNAASSGDKRIADLIKQTDQWSDEACEKWYGEQRKKPFHFGQTIASYRRGDEGAEAKMMELAAKKDGVTPFLARATALDGLSSSSVPGCGALAARLLDDPSEHPVVKLAAIHCLANESAATIRRALIPKLDDPSRLVRIEAAQALASPQTYHALTNNERTRVDLALQTVQSSLQQVADRSGAHLTWALLCEQRGMISEAIKAYETAIRVEPTVAGARTNLAAIFEQLGERGDQAAIEQANVLREQELPLLKRDAGLAPQNATIQYRYGLALYLHGDLEGALKQLQRAADLAPEVDEIQTALQLLKEKMAETKP
jgi:formate-dependent nitrite reductase cytochrome c552 subunit